MGEPWKEGKTRFEGNKVIISMISYPYFASFYHFCLCNARSRKLHEQVSNDIADCNNAGNSLHYVIFLSFCSFSYMLQLCSAFYLWRHSYSKKSNGDGKFTLCTYSPHKRWHNKQKAVNWYMLVTSYAIWIWAKLNKKIIVETTQGI